MLKKAIMIKKTQNDSRPLNPLRRLDTRLTHGTSPDDAGVTSLPLTVFSSTQTEVTAHRHFQ